MEIISTGRGVVVMTRATKCQIRDDQPDRRRSARNRPLPRDPRPLRGRSSAKRPEQLGPDDEHQGGSECQAGQQRDGQAQADDRTAVAKLAEIGEEHHAQAENRREGTGHQRIADVRSTWPRRRGCVVESVRAVPPCSARSGTDRNRSPRRTGSRR